MPKTPKYKVGDKVRFNGNVDSKGWFFVSGDEGTVIDVNPTAAYPYTVKLTKARKGYGVGPGYCDEEHIDLISSSLKNFRYRVGDKVRLNDSVLKEWAVKPGDEGVIETIDESMAWPYYVKMTKVVDGIYLGTTCVFLERHLDPVDDDLFMGKKKKVMFDHDKERAQIRGANIDWFKLNEEFSNGS